MQTIHVNTSAKQKGNGSEEKPFKTLKEAFKHIKKTLKQ